MKSHVKFFYIPALVLIAVFLLLRHLYSVNFVYIDHFPNWLWPLFVNGILGLVVLLSSKRISSPYRFMSTKLLMYIPSVVLLLIIILLSFTFYDAKAATKIDLQRLMLIGICVPLAEELVFRMGFGRWFRSRMGAIWGAYFSLLLFCLVHSNFTFANIAGFFQLSLGVLIVGALIELHMNISKAVLPGLVFHSVANISGIVFMAYAPKLLGIFRLLYH